MQRVYNRIDRLKMPIDTRKSERPNICLRRRMEWSSCLVTRTGWLQCGPMRHGIERLIDTRGRVIDKDQLTSRMKRAKARLADLDEKISAPAVNEDRNAHIPSAMSRLADLSGHPKSQLKK